MTEVAVDKNKERCDESGEKRLNLYMWSERKHRQYCCRLP